MTEHILYLDCSAGISGDMLVASLLDLGINPNDLICTLNTLSVDGYRIEVTEVMKSSVRALDFNVILDHDNHDHDMEYLHGHSDSHEEGTHHHHHDHEHRTFSDIKDILSSGSLTPNAVKIATSIFRILAEAEAASHCKPISEVHFHEVGAIDSIIDIAAIGFCIDRLKPDTIIIPRLCEGYGQVKCMHGILSVPVPAVTNIAKKYHLPISFKDVEGELITPTGAAAAAYLSKGRTIPEGALLVKTGSGAGKRDYNTSGILRAYLMERKVASSLKSEQNDEVMLLETNLDDSTGESLSYAMNCLLDAGALDVWFTPIQMKKNRPAVTFSVLTKLEDAEKMRDILFRTTSTIGIRTFHTQRRMIPRRIIAIETPWGMVDFKFCFYQDETFIYPENDSVTRLARAYNMSYSGMYEKVKAYAEHQWEKGLIY